MAGFLSGKKKELILLVAVLIFCFFILEIAVRMIWYPPQDKGYPKDLHIPDDLLGYKLKPGFIGNFPMSSYEDKKIEVNSKGLRDYEHDYSKEPGKLRILGLGDSCTFGSGTDLSETYLGLLEQELNAQESNVEIVKAGVSGYEFLQELTFYEEEGYKYNPDIVIIGVVLNDLTEPNVAKMKENMAEFGYYDRPADTKMEKLVKNSCYSCIFVYHLFYNYNDKYFKAIYDSWSNEKSVLLYEERLSKLNSEIKSQNATLVLVVFPYTEQFKDSFNSGTEPQDRIKEIAFKQNITVIDLLPYLDIEDYRSIYLEGDNLHLNKRGNIIVANAIKKELHEKGLITFADSGNGLLSFNL